MQSSSKRLAAQRADLPVPRVGCIPRGRSFRSSLTATSRPEARSTAWCTVPKLPTPRSAPNSKRASKPVARPSSVPRPGAGGAACGVARLAAATAALTA